ncbi:MAG: N-acetylmuramoyl-L-alanine amidase [Pseudomonadota bacterium]
MEFEINEDHLIPIESGQAVGRGWTARTDNEPKGVTWHWTATYDLETCRKLLGGANALRKGEASAHYGVGRSFEEGVDRYVTLENRSWHAGVNQILRWDGLKSNSYTKGSRACVGVETINIGYARDGVPADNDWIEAADTNGRWIMKVQPWTEEQFQMMVYVGREIIQRWPHIEYRDHHGHHDICPGYKQDVVGFDFARLLRLIYDDISIPDVWSRLWLPVYRQRALLALGYYLGPMGDDGYWGDYSQNALLQFQDDHSEVTTGYWTTFTNWDIHDALNANGYSIEEAVGFEGQYG